MHQSTLFNLPAPRKPRRKKTRAQRAAERERAFAEFDRNNPHVAELLKEMALALKRAGRAKWGMRNLYEKLRFDLAVMTTEREPVLNDHFAPMFARKLMAECKELASFFETRDR